MKQRESRMQCWYWGSAIPNTTAPRGPKEKIRQTLGCWEQQPPAHHHGLNNTWELGCPCAGRAHRITGLG